MRIKSSQKILADVCCFSDDDLWLGGDENTLEKTNHHFDQKIFDWIGKKIESGESENQKLDPSRNF